MDKQMEMTNFYEYSFQTRFSLISGKHKVMEQRFRLLPFLQLEAIRVQLIHCNP